MTDKYSICVINISQLNVYVLLVLSYLRVVTCACVFLKNIILWECDKFAF